MVIGARPLTGVGFRIAFMVTSVAQVRALSVHGLLALRPFEIFSAETLSLLFTLLTAAVAAPVLGMMGVGPLVAHFFLFYFGIPRRRRWRWRPIRLP